MPKVYNLLGKLAFVATKPASRYLLNRSRRARVVVMRDREILLVKNWLGSQKWSLPGGGIKHGESEQLAGLRELREETGLDLSLDVVSQIKHGRYKNAELKLDFDMTYILVELDSKPAVRRTRPLEIIDIDWFKLNHLPDNLHSEVQAGLQALSIDNLAKSTAI